MMSTESVRTSTPCSAAQFRRLCFQHVRAVAPPRPGSRHALAIADAHEPPTPSDPPVMSAQGP